MDILSFDKMKGRLVNAGSFNESKLTFYKECEDSHYMYTKKGFGISCDAMKMLRACRCKWIVLKYKNEVRAIEFEKWDAMPDEDRNAGPQKFYVWKMMTIVNTKQMTFL